MYQINSLIFQNPYHFYFFYDFEKNKLKSSEINETLRLLDDLLTIFYHSGQCCKHPLCLKMNINILFRK